MNRKEKVSNVMEDYSAEYFRTTGKHLKSIEYRNGWIYIVTTGEYQAKVRLRYCERSVRLLKTSPSFTEKPKESPKSSWEDNTIQFPRLIEEAQAAGAFTESVIQSMSESMDLSIPEIHELLDRAQKTWDNIKKNIK